MAMQLMVSLFSSPNVSYSKEHLEFIGNLLVILWTFAEDFELPIIPGFVDILFLILCAQDEAICETKVLVLQLLYCLCDSPSYKMALQNGKLSVMASLLMQPQAEKCFINSSSLFQLLCRAILECVSVDAQQKEVLKSEALFCISKALEINELDLFEKLSVEVNPRSLTDAQASMIDEFCFHLEALKTALQILTNISAGDDQGDEEEVEDWDEDEDSSMCVDQDDCKSLTKVIQELKIFELILLKIPRISEATFAKFHGSTCLGQFISLWDELQELFLSAMANIAALPSFSFPSDFQVEAILASLIQGLDSKYPQRVISTLGLVRNIVMKQSGLAIESLSTISQLAASTDNPEIMSICLSILGHCCKSPEMLAILTPLFPTMNQILQSCESPSLISSVLNTIFDIFGVDENDVAFRQLSILPVLKDCHSKLSSKVQNVIISRLNHGRDHMIRNYLMKSVKPI